MVLKMDIPFGYGLFTYLTKLRYQENREMKFYIFSLFVSQVKAFRALIGSPSSGLYRCLWRILESKSVGDKFVMLRTDTDVTKIQIWSQALATSRVFWSKIIIFLFMDQKILHAILAIIFIPNFFHKLKKNDDFRPKNSRSRHCKISYSL